MPSVYLEQGGRLRCQAVRGYWQVYDGMPPSAGVDRPRRSAPASAAVVDDVARSAGLPARRPSACAPRSACRCASAAASSACSTPSRRPPLDDAARRGDRALRRRCSSRAPGGARRRSARPRPRSSSPAPPCAWPRSRTPRTSSARRSPRALELAGFESGDARARRRPRRLYRTTPRARSRSRFASSRGDELAAIATWVDDGHVQLHGGRHRRARLRRPRGAAPAPAPARWSCCRWPSAGERLGLLVLADRANHRLATEEVELLELLAVQAAGGLRMAAAVLELRERAARDPLTGLGHHATFHAALPAARRRRAGRGAARADRRRRRLQGDQRHAAATPPATTCCARSPALLRAVAPAGRPRVPDRRRRVRDGLRVRRTRPRARAVGWELRSQARGRLGTTLSVGLALADAGRERRGARRARRRGALRGQAPRPRRRGARRAQRLSVRARLAAVFGRIDHVGVAVADLDAAIALYERPSGCSSCTARRSRAGRRGGAARRR